MEFNANYHAQIREAITRAAQQAEAEKNQHREQLRQHIWLLRHTALRLERMLEQNAPFEHQQKLLALVLPDEEWGRVPR